MKKNYRIVNAFVLTTITLFIKSTNLYAQEASEKITLDVEKAVELALENNISVKQSELKLKTARRNKNTSWNSVSPSVSLGAGLSKSNKDFDDNYSTYVSGKINLSLSGNIYSNIRTALLNYEAGEINYETTCRTVEKNVRSAFYQILYLNDKVKLQESSIETAKNQYESNLAKYRQGAISQLDVLTSRVDYEKQKPALESAISSRDNALAQFKQITGIPQSNEIELTGSLDDVLSLKEITLEGIQAASPELKALEKNLEIAKAAVWSNRMTAYSPVISAGWSYQPTKSKAAAAREPTDWIDNGALSLSVTIPLDGILPWSKNQVAVQNSRDTVKDYELQIKDKKTSIEVQNQSSLRNISQHISSIESLKASIELAEQTYNMTREAYSRGSRDFLALQSASNSLETARLNLKSEAYSLMTEILSLEYNLGVPFGTLLAK